MAEVPHATDVVTRAVRQAMLEGPQLVAIDSDDRKVLRWAADLLSGDLTEPVSPHLRRHVVECLDALHRRPGVPGALSVLPTRAHQAEE